jgi:hypothetical protein
MKRIALRIKQAEDTIAKLTSLEGVAEAVEIK